MVSKGILSLLGEVYVFMRRLQGKRYYNTGHAIDRLIAGAASNQIHVSTDAGRCYLRFNSQRLETRERYPKAQEFADSRSCCVGHVFLIDRHTRCGSDRPGLACRQEQADNHR